MLPQTLILDRGLRGTLFPSKSIILLEKLAHLRYLYHPEDFYGVKKNGNLRYTGLIKLETLENFDTLFCELKDLLKLTNLHKLRLKLRDYQHKPVFTNCLAALGQSSTSSFRYWALDFEMHYEWLLNNPNMIRRLE